MLDREVGFALQERTLSAKPLRSEKLPDSDIITLDGLAILVGTLSRRAPFVDNKPNLSQFR